MVATDDREPTMGRKRLAKKVDKFERKAERFKDKASVRAQELSGQASAKAQELGEKAATMTGKQPEKKSRKGLVTLVMAALAGVGLMLKKKREQELDEALWEEPRAL
jgi:hypothetical protein